VAEQRYQAVLAVDLGLGLTSVDLSSANQDYKSVWGGLKLAAGRLTQPTGCDYRQPAGLQHSTQEKDENPIGEAPPTLLGVSPRPGRS